MARAERTGLRCCKTVQCQHSLLQIFDRNLSRRNKGNVCDHNRNMSRPLFPQPEPPRSSPSPLRSLHPPISHSPGPLFPFPLCYHHPLCPHHHHHPPYHPHPHPPSSSPTTQPSTPQSPPRRPCPQLSPCPIPTSSARACAVWLRCRRRSRTRRLLRWQSGIEIAGLWRR